MSDGFTVPKRSHALAPVLVTVTVPIRWPAAPSQLPTVAPSAGTSHAPTAATGIDGEAPTFGPRPMFIRIATAASPAANPAPARSQPKRTPDRRGPPAPAAAEATATWSTGTTAGSV